jgi:hypothetical protein
MKIPKGALWFGPLIFLAIFSGCAKPTQSRPSLSIRTPTIPGTLNMAATPTRELSPTNTPVSPATPMDVSTLPAEDASQRLLTLLANNGDCRLPCLWGITPGKSSYLVARFILLPLRGIAETAYFDFTASPVDDITPLYIENDLRLKTRVAYAYDNDGVVNYILFRAVEQQLGKDEYGNLLTTPIFDSETFAKRVEYYSHSRVLSEHGLPDSVLIYIPRVEGQPIVAGIMELALLYPEQGIWIKYTLPMYKEGNIIRGCPANAHVEMALFPQGDPDNFYKLLDQTDWPHTKGGFKPLEETASMSIEEFYEIFRNPTDICLETPTELWLTSEP